MKQSNLFDSKEIKLCFNVIIFTSEILYLEFSGVYNDNSKLLHTCHILFPISTFFAGTVGDISGITHYTENGDPLVLEGSAYWQDAWDDLVMLP